MLARLVLSLTLRMAVSLGIILNQTFSGLRIPKVMHTCKCLVAIVLSVHLLSSLTSHSVSS